ncbi:MAG: hypothetical protein Q9199_005549 [Rusavskia elegans]
MPDHYTFRVWSVMTLGPGDTLTEGKKMQVPVIRYLPLGIIIRDLARVSWTTNTRTPEDRALRIHLRFGE